MSRIGREGSSLSRKLPDYLAVVSAIAFSLIATTHGHSQVPLTLPTPTSVSSAADRILINYDESAMTDTHWARLAEVLRQDVPITEWREITVQSNDALETIIDRYYDVYRNRGKARFSAPLPETTATLSRIIKVANGLGGSGPRAGTILRIPPLPYRPASGPGLAKVTRTYDPRFSSYGLIRSDEIVALPLITTASADRAAPARMVTETIISISEERASDLTGFPMERLPPTRYAKVELLQSPPCANPDVQFASSPYLAKAKERLTLALPRLETAAKNRRLALLDFDFDFSNGHGAQVYSAAAWLLERLGITSLTANVAKVELNKAAAKKELEVMLHEYIVFAEKRNHGVDQKQHAAVWLIDPIEGMDVGETIYSIPSVLMSAAMWKYLNEGAWLNLSWQIESTTSTQPWALLQTLQAEGSFVAVAAGNERTAAVRYDLFPQSAASAFREFVNVTYGTKEGVLYGSHTSAPGTGGGQVDLLAPGCGFQYMSLRENHSGSSYASAIVATAAWIKTLLDGTSSISMRHALVHGSLLVPPVATATTLSGGVFDPARLLTLPQMHYLTPDRSRMVAITSPKLDAGSCGVHLPIDDTASRDFLVYRRDGKYFLLRRHDDLRVSPLGVIVEDPCELTTLAFTAVTADGPLNITSPQAFVQTIGHLTF